MKEMMQNIGMILLAILFWILRVLWKVVVFVFDALVMIVYIGIVLIGIFFIGVVICWMFGLLIY